MVSTTCPRPVQESSLARDIRRGEDAERVACHHDQPEVAVPLRMTASDTTRSPER